MGEKIWKPNENGLKVVIMLLQPYLNYDSLLNFLLCLALSCSIHIWSHPLILLFKKESYKLCPDFSDTEIEGKCKGEKKGVQN